MKNTAKSASQWQLHPIPGGIQPKYNKSQSLGEPLSRPPLPEKLIIPLSQHIGARARPLVETGQRVLKAQPIAEATAAISAPLHAPSSGIVTAIGPHRVPHSSGLTAPCIIIEPDGQEEWSELNPVADYTALEPQALLKIIRQAGITGLGGAGFPTAPKLQSGKRIETLIINGVECEPYITADDMLMQCKAAEIIEGIEIIAHLVRPQQIVIAVEDNKSEAFAQLVKAAAGTEIHLVQTPTSYPSGGERQLVQMLLGVEIPSGQLPASVGVLCQNVGTVAAVSDAVVRGIPLISRITTVTGEAVSRPRNYETLLGTPVAHLLSTSGIDHSQLGRLIMGGPMMGFTLTDTEVPVIKSTNCLLAASHTEMPPPAPAQACIRCGLCAEACPATLLPQQLYWFARAREHEKLETHNLFDCIECGACSWVCPSNIPLVQYYRAAKAEISEKRREEQKAEVARQRFEFHQHRIDEQAREREERRQQRRKKAAASGSNDLVQAAIERAQQRRQAAASKDSDSEALQAQTERLKARLAKAEQRLAEAEAAGSDSATVAALVAGREKLQLKLAASEQQLQDNGQAPTAATSKDSDSEALQAQTERLKARLAKAEQRLAEAEAAGSDSATVAALVAGREKLQLKLAASEQQLQDSGQAPTAATSKAQAGPAQNGEPNSISDSKEPLTKD